MIKIHKAVFLISLTISVLLASIAIAESSIYKLDSVREAIIKQGNNMPSLIRDAKAENISTLERVFELSTSALTTIEAYLKMVRIVIVSKADLDGDVLKTLNEWLTFIKTQCDYDLEYLNEARSQTKDEIVLEQVSIAESNIKTLKDVMDLAIEENRDFAER